MDLQLPTRILQISGWYYIMCSLVRNLSGLSSIFYKFLQLSLLFSTFPTKELSLLSLGHYLCSIYLALTDSPYVRSGQFRLEQGQWASPLLPWATSPCQHLWGLSSPVSFSSTHMVFPFLLSVQLSITTKPIIDRYRTQIRWEIRHIQGRADNQQRGNHKEVQQPRTHEEQVTLK